MFAASFPAFDKYRSKYFVGEMVWNFADFETAQCEAVRIQWNPSIKATPDVRTPLYKGHPL